MPFRNFDPKPIYRKWKRLIGNGSVGGKGKGLAFALACIEGSELEPLVDLPPVNYVLTTEIFRDFLDDNNIAPVIDELQGSMDTGLSEEDRAIAFHEGVVEAFARGKMRKSLERDIDVILDNITSPLAVRSSSLLEDSERLSFAGKYSTCFSSNGGNRESNRRELIASILTVWTSLYNPAARAYRSKHGLTDGDEAMAVIIEPVMGRRHASMFYPELAGTAFSRVYRRPSPRIRKENGVIRLCFGLGTRTVDRQKARVFYLSHPMLRPEGNMPLDIYQRSQTKFDYIDIQTGQFLTGTLDMFLPFILREHKAAASYIEKFYDNTLYWAGSEPGAGASPIFSFSDFPRRNPHFFDLVTKLISHLEDRMDLPVDCEFTYDCGENSLCLVQLRPLAAYEEMSRVRIPERPMNNILLRGDRMVSNGMLENIEYLVYVDPLLYGRDGKFFEVAREIGRINTLLAGSRYILVGPGRWGSNNPDLGVPIKYNEICHCGCMVELGISESSYTPELSYGTHFFLDLDVDGILYLPVFDGQQKNVFNRSWFENTPYIEGLHPAVRIYRNEFSVHLDGDSEEGAISVR